MEGGVQTSIGLFNWDQWQFQERNKLNIHDCVVWCAACHALTFLLWVINFLPFAAGTADD